VLGEEGEDFGFGEVEAEGFEGDFEFVVVYLLVFVEVEEPKLYILLLVFGSQACAEGRSVRLH